MNRARHVIRIVGAVLLGVAVAGTPALTYAQHAGGGHGGGGGGGGAHMGGGGGHAGGPAGGGHMGGPMGGGHVSPGAHMGVVPHYGGSYPAVRGGPSTYHAYHGAYTGRSAYAGRGVGYVGRPGYGVAPGHGGPTYPAVHGGAYMRGNAYWHGAHYYGGGYYHGAYWPYTYFRPGWAWYLPVLPIGYATFWWGGYPYYYWNNLYYTWSPGYNGYVVTDPPPVAQYSDPTTGEPGFDPNSVTAEPEDDSGSAQPDSANTGGGSGEVYIYPRNGQTDQQMANDRYECHAWAANQTGFDPTRQQNQGDPQEYRRAMVACLDARGYSAR